MSRLNPIRRLSAGLTLIVFLLSVVVTAFLPAPTQAASVLLNPASGFVGTSVLISGGGFTGRIATIYWDGQPIAVKIPIPQTGQVTYKFAVPYTTKGEHVIKVADDSNWEVSTAVAKFMVLPQITISPNVGKTWTEVTVMGDGFAANERDIRVVWDGKTLPGVTINADVRGRWSYSFNVADAAKGNHTIGAFSKETAATEIPQCLFIIGPVAKAEPVSGPVGTEVTMSGVGFRVGEDGISFTYDGEMVLCNVVAEADGSWKTTLVIPASTAGNHVIGTYGSSFTPKGIVPNVNFRVTPKLALQTGVIKKDNQLPVVGTGFAKGEEITFTSDVTKLDTKAVADGTGSFNLVLVLPPGKTREHVLVGTGNMGNSAQLSYVTEAIALAAPKLLSPVQGAKLEAFSSVGDVILGTAQYFIGVIDYLRGKPRDISKSAVTTFAWSGVGDTAGVSYVIEIRSIDKPTSPVLVKMGLTDSKYALSRPDRLAAGTYTWRVKAVDGRGNESQWSESWLFETVSMSTTNFILSVACLVLFVVLVVVVALIWRARRATW